MLHSVAKTSFPTILILLLQVRTGSAHGSIELNHLSTNRPEGLHKAIGVIEMGSEITIGHNVFPEGISGVDYYDTVNIALASSINITEDDSSFDIPGGDSGGISNDKFAAWLAVDLPTNKTLRWNVTLAPPTLIPTKLGSLPFIFDNATKPLSLDQNYRLSIVSGKTTLDGGLLRLVPLSTLASTNLAPTPTPTNPPKTEGVAAMTLVSRKGVTFAVIVTLMLSGTFVL